MRSPRLCPRCHRPRRTQLLTTSGKVFAFPRKLVLPTGRRGMKMAAGAGLCCCTVCEDEDLLPDADVSDGSWEDTSGGNSDGNLWNEIEEAMASADDGTSYVQREITVTSTGSYDDAGNEFEIALSNPTGAPDPGVGAVWNCRLRAQIVVVSGVPSFHGLRCKLMEGSTTIATGTGSPLAFWTTASYCNPSQAERESVSDYTNLRLRVACRSDGFVGTITVKHQISTADLHILCPP